MLNEADTRAKLIDPKLHEAGWEEGFISREYHLTDGRIRLVGDTHLREEQKRADYVLRYTNALPIAVVEAKDESHSPLDGIQKAKDYAEMLGVVFAYSTNGHGIEEFDFITNQQMSLERFPRPEELWNRYVNWKTDVHFPSKIGEPGVTWKTSRDPLLHPYYYEPGGKRPHYYQEIAIREFIEAILKGRERILLAMATGTGKTFVAFQIAWKLLKSGFFKRVLYIADRNFLRDQAHNNEFFPFGDARAFIEEGKAPKNRDIFFSIYQALYSDHKGKRLYREYPRDFFDLVIIDECHRSGFGTWHEILEYFSQAVHLGMTATPKRDDNIDTYAYFGEPVYSYSMGQGIEDGFLAPFQLYRIFTNIDQEGLHLQDALYQGAQVYMPEEADVKDLYTLEDFEREIVLPDRTKKISEHVANLLHTFGPMQKTMIFCVNMEHAAQVAKELQNYFSSLGHPDYAVRIVSQEPDAKVRYEQFRDSEKPTPVVATTVDLLTTGVDVPSATNIILIKPIASKVYFKQIIGRGTRIDQITSKFFFRIIDYVNASRLLDDWDYPKGAKAGKIIQGPFDLALSGLVIHKETQEPLAGIMVVAQVGPNIQRQVRTEHDGRFTLTELPHSPITLYFRAAGFRSRQLTITPLPEMEPLIIELKPERPAKEPIRVENIEVHIAEETRIVFTADGRTLTEAEYIGYSREGVIRRAASLHELREIWIEPEKRTVFLNALKGESIFPYLLAAILRHPAADTFDLLAHVAFNAPILSRDERAQVFLNRCGQFLSAFGTEAHEVILALLDKYRVGGVEEIRPEVFHVPPFDRMGYIEGIIQRFGGDPHRLRAAMDGLQKEIYAELA